MKLGVCEVTAAADVTTNGVNEGLELVGDSVVIGESVVVWGLVVVGGAVVIGDAVVFGDAVVAHTRSVGLGTSGVGTDETVGEATVGKSVVTNNSNYYVYFK